jgi:deoxyhypusine synthase
VGRQHTGNIFASYVIKGELKASTVKNGIEYMVWLADYTKKLQRQGVGFFQVVAALQAISHLRGTHDVPGP